MNGKKEDDKKIWLKVIRYIAVVLVLFSHTDVFSYGMLIQIMRLLICIL